MASDYPLEELGPRAFEQLTVALAMAVLGPGVEAFGAGPDGGREATYTGPVNWSATTDMGDDSWNGYVVVQAKQMEHLGDPRGNAVWLRRQIADEFDSWMNENSQRGQFPRYILFVTNARLSSVPGVGGIDAVNEYIRKRWTGEDSEKPTQNGLQYRGMRAWKIWHRDQLNTLLTMNDGIRRAFPAMLTAGDLLHRLSSTTLTSPANVHKVLTAHASSALTQERWINFGEAGGDGTARQSIETVMVDLPAVIAGTDLRGQAVRTILERGDQVLRKSLTFNDTSRHIVLTGAPGNGKSTVSKFLIQLYRTTFLLSESLPAGASDVKRDTLTAASRLRLPLPKNRRWPMRVDLTDLADDLGSTIDKSLLRLAQRKDHEASRPRYPTGNPAQLAPDLALGHHLRRPRRSLIT